MSDHARSRFEQLRRFLASRGAPATAYRLAPASRPCDHDADANALLIATYAAERFRNGNPIAWLYWSTPSGHAEVRTDRSSAEFAIAFAFDQPEHLAMFTDLPADAEPAAAASRLGLDPGVLRRQLGASDAGCYVAPEGNRWTYFLVETYGEVVILADGPNAAPLLQMLAADRMQEQQNLAARMAAFLPDTMGHDRPPAAPIDPR